MSDAERAKTEAAVKSCYSTWADSYYADYYESAAAYPPVHVKLVRDLLSAARVRTLLDVGCGPASMLRSLDGMGIDLYGFDLTPEMITAARKVMRHVPADHFWEGSILNAQASRPPSGKPSSFDAAICIGVFPHLSVADEERAIGNLHDAVSQGGVVAIEARNQLFGLFTLNRYSYELFASELIDWDALRAAGVDREAIDAITQTMKEHFRMDLPPVRRGKAGKPGYDEALSRTHNPLTLRATFEAAGFSDVKTLFYHYHCLPPMFEQVIGKNFRDVSVAMEDPLDWRGHFMASAFILVGRRR